MLDLIGSFIVGWLIGWTFTILPSYYCYYYIPKIRRNAASISPFFAYLTNPFCFSSELQSDLVFDFWVESGEEEMGGTELMKDDNGDGNSKGEAGGSSDSMFNILENHDFAQGMESWFTNCCKWYVVTSATGDHLGMFVT